MSAWLNDKPNKFTWAILIIVIFIVMGAGLKYHSYLKQARILRKLNEYKINLEIRENSFKEEQEKANKQEKYGLMPLPETDDFMMLVKKHKANQENIEKQKENIEENLNNLNAPVSIDDNFYKVFPQAFADEIIMREKLTAIFNNLNKTYGGISEAEKEMIKYSGLIEIYNLAYESKVFQAINESNPIVLTIGTWLAPWSATPYFGGNGWRQFKYKSQESTTQKVFGEDYKSYINREVIEKRNKFLLDIL